MLPSVQGKVKIPTYERYTWGTRLLGLSHSFRQNNSETCRLSPCFPCFTVELFHQLAFFILSCKTISYCRFKRIDVYIL